MEKLRAQCLERGAHGIKGFARIFRVMDDNRDRKLDREELQQGMEDYGMSLDAEEVEEIFTEFDQDETGTIYFEEFLKGLRPPMSDTRIDMINQAFDKMDASGEGLITISDLKNVYDPSYHPKFQSGDMSEDEVFQEFLNSFDVPDDPDGTVTREDFLNYYSGVSASIDDDEYFVEMMKGSWKLE
ncbi:calcyphosin-like protein [Centruroides vittatus]|uniref:calcyphosin-like protein n=2 Tax=Centruroides TaxID=6875 RepID=UPI000C6EB2DB|nr:calcyphosin-like protein isoform X1 [Centruroides sculpturatus]